jgi:hypothetical protein
MTSHTVVLVVVVVMVEKHALDTTKALVWLAGRPAAGSESWPEPILTGL